MIPRKYLSYAARQATFRPRTIIPPSNSFRPLSTRTTNADSDSSLIRKAQADLDRDLTLTSSSARNQRSREFKGPSMPISRHNAPILPKSNRFRRTGKPLRLEGTKEERLKALIDKVNKSVSVKRSGEGVGRRKDVIGGKEVEESGSVLINMMRGRVEGEGSGGAGAGASKAEVMEGTEGDVSVGKEEVSKAENSSGESFKSAQAESSDSSTSASASTSKLPRTRTSSGKIAKRPTSTISTVATSSKQASSSRHASTEAQSSTEAPDDESTNERGAAPHLSLEASNRLIANSQRILEGSVVASDVKFTEVRPEREMKVARLRKGLPRVLFSPGVHWLHCPRTGVWNFNPDGLQEITQPDEYAYDRSPQYTAPSRDTELAELAKAAGCQFTGSTSTLTKALSQIYFAISGGKGPDFSPLSQAFTYEKKHFSPGATLPACLVIGKSRSDPEKYYVDSDKSYDTDNILSDFGVILEKVLTSEPEEFKRFLKSSPETPEMELERNAPEAYMYQKANNILMRSQLDCHDPRLPGTGVFDIKTRVCMPIRHDRSNYAANSAYDIWKERGYTESYEREYYDLIRSAMMKYSMQVRIGKMDGIFLAYHNTARIFGFQYIPLTEMDERLFGSTEMGDQSFQLTVGLLETLLGEIVTCYPDQEVEVELNANTPNPTPDKARYITAYVRPKTWNKDEGLQPIQAITMAVESFLDGEKVVGPVEYSVDEEVRRGQSWSVQYTIYKSSTDQSTQAQARIGHQQALKSLLGMSALAVPEGKTADDMYEEDLLKRNSANKEGKTEAEEGDDESIVTQWVAPSPRTREMRTSAIRSGEAYAERRKGWEGALGKSWVDVD